MGSIDSFRQYQSNLNNNSNLNMNIKLKNNEKFINFISGVASSAQPSIPVSNYDT